MILTTAGDIERYTAAGVWGHLALDELFVFTARKGQGGVAVADPANRAGLFGGIQRTLTWEKAATAIEALASRFLALGLRADDIVAIQLPNTVEAYLTLLALFRARLIACPLPPTWREHDMKSALGQLAPRALVTMGRMDGFSHADMMCYVASEQPSVRHVMAFGENLPDGVISLTPVLENPQPAEDTELPGHRRDAANHVALVTLEAGAEGVPRPVARSHNQLIAGALLHTAVANFKRKDVVLSAHYPTSLLPLTSIFVPWVLTGMRLALHEPFDADRYFSALIDSRASYAMLPAGVLKAMSKGDFDWGRTALTRIGCAWATAQQARSAGRDAPRAGKVPVNDLYAFGEIATYAAHRGAGHVPGRIPVGAIRLSEEDRASPVVLETRVRGGIQKAGAGDGALSGNLQLRGPIVPVHNLGAVNDRIGTDDADGIGENDDAPFLDTGVQALLCSTAPPAADCLTAGTGFLHVGSSAVSVQELDRLVAGHSGVSDGAVYSVPDAILGSRIEAAVVPREGAQVSSEDMRTYLRSRKVAEYKIPDRVVKIGRIPRTEDGGVDRERLARGPV